MAIADFLLVVGIGSPMCEVDRAFELRGSFCQRQNHQSQVVTLGLKCLLSENEYEECNFFMTNSAKVVKCVNSVHRCTGL